MAEKFVPAVPIDQFNVPLRNIRATLDGLFLQLELIPSIVLDEPDDCSDLPAELFEDPAILKIIAGGRPIVEADRFMRVVFEPATAIVVQEEFVELFDQLKADFDAPPKFAENKGWFPFLKVENSTWRSKLPDYQGGEGVSVEHFKIVSMETEIDVLGVLDSWEWCSS